MGAPIKDIIAGGIEGLLGSAGDIISKFKADPTKVIEAEAELQKLKIQAATETERIAMQIEAEKTKQIEAEQKAISDRWSADMASDSWMSKNTRPIGFLSTLGFLFLMIILDACDIKFEVKDSYISLMELLLITIVGAYYGGRTIEKYQSIKSNR